MNTNQVMTEKEARKWLSVYFKFFTELRTIADDDTGVITKKDINSLDSDVLIMAAEDAAYCIRCETA